MGRRRRPCQHAGPSNVECQHFADLPVAVMPEPTPDPKESGNPLATLFRRGLDHALSLLMNWLSFLRSKTEDTRHQLQQVFYSTSDQVLERAEETRKSVKLRMAILEIEHHLNRLYPQIGKLTCDLATDGTDGWPDNADLHDKVELANEYRQRLDTLRSELEEHQQRIRAQRG